MSQDTSKPVATLQDVEIVRDLFARAHDYIAQATYPGHMGQKISEVLNFLAFQHNDFKLRAEVMIKAIEAGKAKAAEVVNVEAAKDATQTALANNPKA